MKDIKTVRYTIEIDVPYDASEWNSKERKRIEKDFADIIKQTIYSEMSRMYFYFKIDKSLVEFSSKRTKSKIVSIEEVEPPVKK